MKKQWLILTLIFIGLIGVSYAEDVTNALTCEIEKTSSPPPNYQPLLYVLAGDASTYDPSSDLVFNAHVSNYSSSISPTPQFALYCSAGSYGKIGGMVVGPPGCSKYSSLGFMALINLSDAENAHLKLKDGSSLTGNYNYQLCIYPYDTVGSYITCKYEYGKECDSGYTCLFKLTGVYSPSATSFAGTNAHLYECGYDLGSTPYYTVCCQYHVGLSNDVITDVSSPIAGSISATSTEKNIYVLLGLTDNFIVNLYNPSDTPKVVDLYLETNNNLFKYFLWFEDEGKRYSEDPTHIQLTIPPKQSKSVTVNVFGGKVGIYDLIIKKVVDGDPASENVIYNSTVTVIPGKTPGTVGKSPEGSYILLLTILSMAALLIK